jgi:hypothetical protein
MQMLLAALTFVVFFASLTGCMPIGIPAMFANVPALTYASYGKSAFDVASYAGSGKSISDHVMSNVMKTDCAMFNILEGNICKDNKFTIDSIGRFNHLYFKIEEPKDNLNRFRI